MRVLLLEHIDQTGKMCIDVLNFDVYLLCSTQPNTSSYIVPDIQLALSTMTVLSFTNIRPLFIEKLILDQFDFCSR